MKKQSFKIPVDATPDEIIDCMTDEQHHALTLHLTAGVTEYYRSMMDELDRVEADLRRAGELIARQRAAMRNLMAVVPLVKLRSGIDLTSSLN